MTVLSIWHTFINVPFYNLKLYKNFRIHSTALQHSTECQMKNRFFLLNNIRVWPDFLTFTMVRHIAKECINFRPKFNLFSIHPLHKFCFSSFISPRRERFRSTLVSRNWVSLNITSHSVTKLTFLKVCGRNFDVNLCWWVKLWHVGRLSPSRIGDCLSSWWIGWRFQRRACSSLYRDGNKILVIE